MHVEMYIADSTSQIYKVRSRKDSKPSCRCWELSQVKSNQSCVGFLRRSYSIALSVLELSL